MDNNNNPLAPSASSNAPLSVSGDPNHNNNSSFFNSQNNQQKPSNIGQYNIDIWGNDYSSQGNGYSANTAPNVNNNSSANSNNNVNTHTNSHSGSSYDALSLNTSLSSPTELYKSKFASIDIGSLGFQSIQLSSGTKDISSQLTTPSLIQNSFFPNSNVNYSRQVKDIPMTTDVYSQTNKNVTNNVKQWQNSNSYSNYLLQQQQQQQQQQHQQQHQHQHQQHQQQPQTQTQTQTQTQQHNNHQQNQSHQHHHHHQQQQPIQQFGSYAQQMNNSLTNEHVQENNNTVRFSNNYTLTSNNRIDNSEIEQYKTTIQLKDIIISKLELELEKMKDFQSTMLKTQAESEGNFEIPKNYEELYHKLVEKIQSTEAELNDTKTRLESLVTAIALNPNPSTFKNSRYDEEEISHKIISKLKVLTEENEELTKMVSYGKSKEKDIEIALLRKQNNDLLEKVAKLEAKLNDKKN